MILNQHDIRVKRQSKFESGETAESSEFYAVVLDSEAIGFSEGDYCNDFTETKRLAAQKLFPKHKVFASHYCELENVIIYKGFGDWRERNLLAAFVCKSARQTIRAQSAKPPRKPFEKSAKETSESPTHKDAGGD